MLSKHLEIVFTFFFTRMRLMHAMQVAVGAKAFVLDSLFMQKQTNNRKRFNEMSCELKLSFVVYNQGNKIALLLWSLV